MAKSANVTPSKLIPYKLASGVVVQTVRPVNSIRRVLLNQPEVNRQNLAEILAAACVHSIEFPANYDPDQLDAHVVEVDREDESDVWRRLDLIEMKDVHTFVAAFNASNAPTAEMIETVMDGLKAKK